MNFKLIKKNIREGSLQAPHMDSKKLFETVRHFDLFQKLESCSSITHITEQLSFCKQIQFKRFKLLNIFGFQSRFNLLLEGKIWVFQKKSFEQEGNFPEGVSEYQDQLLKYFITPVQYSLLRVLNREESFGLERDFLLDHQKCLFVSPGPLSIISLDGD